MMSVYRGNPFKRAGNGPDVSNWNPNVNWTTVHRHCAFAFCKATEGVAYHDPTFPHNWKTLGALKFWRGTYHFAHPGSNSPVDEAHFFVDYVEANGGWQFGKRDLPPVLDLETEPGTNTVQWVNEFLAAVSRRTRHKRPMLYTSPGFWNGLNGAHRGAQAYLWLADYSWAPITPIGFSRWDFWQHTDGQVGAIPRSIPGIGNCDVSLFRGNFASLHRMCL